MASGFLTIAEFERWREGEHAFRGEIKADLKELLGLVREQNGRLWGAEQNIAVIQRDLAAVVSEDIAIDATVNKILTEGCDQYRTHKEVVTALEGSGALPNTDGPMRPFSLRNLSPKQKAAAGVGVGALLIPAVSDLLKLGTAVVQWIHQTAGKTP